MTYNEILTDIFSILEVDYAGAADKLGWLNKAAHYHLLEQRMADASFSDADFIAFISDLLTTYKDPHMFFLNVNPTEDFDNGFEVRRFEDCLYVTEVWQPCGLSVGDVITALDGLSIPALSAEYQPIIELYGSGYEREIWRPILKKHYHYTLLTPSGILEQPLHQFPKRCHQGEYSFNFHPSGTPIMKLTDFADDNAIHSLVSENQCLLESTDHLIIDVRVNKGGSDSAYLNLLPFLFNEEFQLSDLDDATMQLMMTERNDQLRKTEIASYLEQIDDPASKAFLESFLNFLEQHKNQGLVDVDLAELIPNVAINTKKGPKKIIVLSDVYCGSSGDSFIDLVKKSDKVTVVGRPTAGITDYSNLATQNYDNRFSFMYPTSRNKQIDQGRGVTGKGHSPHYYIPWTPQHLVNDLDLEYAVQLLNTSV